MGADLVLAWYNGSMFYLVGVISGLISGSFLNAFIWRHRRGRTLLTRSECPHCGGKLAWFDLIPILSFLRLGAHCRYCHSKISWQYPIVEAVTALLFLLSVNVFSPQSDFSGILNIVLIWYLLWVFLGIFIYDLRYGEIPDKFTIPAVIIFLILPWRSELVWREHLLSGLVGGGFFALQLLISKGKWVGGGDIRLGALMGLILGLPKLLLALVLAYLSGALLGIGLILSGKKTLQSRLPFGTFLSAAAVAALFYGKFLINWYMELLR